MCERNSRDNKYHALSTKPGLEKRINESLWFLYWYHPYHHPLRMRVCLCLGMIRPHLSISFSSSNPSDKNNSKNHWFECLLCVSCCILPLYFNLHKPLLYYVLLTTFYKGRNQNWDTHSQQVVEADSNPSRVCLTPTDFSLPLLVCSEQGNLKQYLIRKSARTST